MKNPPRSGPGRATGAILALMKDYLHVPRDVVKNFSRTILQPRPAYIRASGGIGSRSTTAEGRLQGRRPRKWDARAGIRDIRLSRLRRDRLNAARVAASLR